MAVLMEPSSSSLNPIFPSNSNPYRRDLRVFKKPPTILLRLHSPARSADPPCCAATPPSLGDQEPAPDSSPERTRDRRRAVRLAWEKLVRWSRSWRSKAKTDVLEKTEYVYVILQFSSSFLAGIAEHVDPGLPFISLSKGLELNTLRMMSQIIPHALKNQRQPFIALSGPSFALELMNRLPTAMVVASKDKKLANAVQQLLASDHLRISTSSDVTGVEIAGALKNVLAIAAGIVEGMNLGNNSMAALVAQGCSEIRWLATKMGAKPTTITGLSGTGDIMLTCFVNLSRNRMVGVRLGSGEKLEDILSSMSQVAEGVSTAGAVVALAQKYNVKMPVLTAVARIIDNELTPKKAVFELMSLPQVIFNPFESQQAHAKEVKRVFFHPHRCLLRLLLKASPRLSPIISCLMLLLDVGSASHPSSSSNAD